MVQRIPLDKDKFALVDDEVYTLVAPRTWHARLQHGVWYALTNMALHGGAKRPVYMHRFIMNAKQGQRVDHEDGDGLNNTGRNLRFCSHQQNMQNRRQRRAAKTSKYRGVSRNPKGGKWIAQIKVDGVLNESGKPLRHLGAYDTEFEAARVYDWMALNFFGEFASINFPRENYSGSTSIRS